MNTNLFFKPIFCEDEAIAYIQMLVDDGLAYHFDEPAEEVIDMSLQRVFDDKTAMAANRRAEELRNVVWSAYGDEFYCVMQLLQVACRQD